MESNLLFATALQIHMAWNIHSKHSKIPSHLQYDFFGWIQIESFGENWRDSEINFIVIKRVHQTNKEIYRSYPLIVCILWKKIVNFF